MRLKSTLGALLMVGVLGAGCATGTDAVAQGETFEFISPDGQLEIYYDPPADRKPVDQITGPDILDPDTTLNLQEDHAGEVVVLNTWGQSCGPCRAEVDDLQRLQDEFAPQFGTNLRDPNRQKPDAFIEGSGVAYQSSWDPRDAGVAALRGFATSVVPTTLLLDRQHRVAAVFLVEITDDKLHGTIERLLSEEVSPA